MSKSPRFARSLFLAVCSMIYASCRSPSEQIGPPVEVGTRDLTIGGEHETREEYTFGAISGLAFAPDGRIVVTDLKENVVRVFAPSGVFAYAIGREGAGPAELRNPMSATFSDGGLLWVRDEGNRRFNAYSLASTHATFRMSVRYDHAPSGPHRVEPIPFDAAGRIISIGTIADKPGEYRRARFVIDLAGAVVRVDTIANPPADSFGDRRVTSEVATADGRGATTHYYYQPYGPTFITAHSLSGAMARTVTSRYDIEWFGADGTALRTIRRAVQAPELSVRERKSGQETIDGFLTRAKVSASSVPGLPRRKPPIRHIAFDSMGRLWVERSVADSAPREADVYGENGLLEAIMRWPREVDLLGLQLVATSGAFALGLATDSLGVERVARLRFR